MKPTRALFELVARIISAELGDTLEGHRVAEAFADEFSRVNYRFDRQRFYRACFPSRQKDDSNA